MSSSSEHFRPVGRAAPEEALQRALFALNNRRHVEAEEIAQSVLTSDPRQSRALHILGCALLLQGRAEAAIAPLETAARSHDPEIMTQLAMALRQAGRHDDACDRLKRAANRKPPYPPAFRELGNLLVFLERYDNAIEVLRRGLNIAPMMPELSIQLGYALLSARRCAEAAAAFTRALDISPAAPEALYGMAKTLQQIGDNSAAEGYFRRYLMAMPDDQNAWLSLGRCLLAAGQFNAGHDCFRAAAARGGALGYGRTLVALVAAGHGRFWLTPSAAARFMRKENAVAG